MLCVLLLRGMGDFLYALYVFDAACVIFVLCLLGREATLLRILWM